jgi:hypothetical protein
VGAYPIDFIVLDCDYPNQRRDTTRAIFSITTDLRPVIISPATVNFEENACAVLYDAQTSDPNYSEGSGLTYSLAAGDDASKFSIDALTGVLSWAPGFVPNFENPVDVNTDNVYQVEIIVANTNGLTNTLELSVAVTNQATEPFVALINGGNSLFCSSGSVNFSATGGVGYVWNTGETTATILALNAGSYTVTVTSTGNCTATATAMLAAPPSITALGNNGTVCLGANIQLSSTPVGGTLPYASFSWTGPNNYSANIEDPAGFPAIAGSGGTYSVTVTDASGCTASAAKVITVTSNPAPSISASNNTPVCAGATLSLSSTPTGGSGTYTQFSWTGPNNYQATTQNPAGFTATIAYTGTYQVTVTDNAGCKGTASTSVVVNPKPTITAASNSPICVGGTILLTSTPTGGSGVYTQFSWAGPGNYSASVQNPSGFSAALTSTGTYNVTVTDNAGCSNTSTTNVSVNGPPSITAALLGPVCTNGAVALSSTPTGGSGPYASFLWTGPNNYTNTVEDPAAFPVTPLVSGTYTVKVTDLAGCTASNSISVTVNTLPSITAFNNGPVCEGSNITLSSTPSGGSGTYSFFQWTGPDSYVASVEDPVPVSTTEASAGIYQVKVTDSNGCTATATTTVGINAKPSLTASSNTPLCTGANLNLQSAASGGSGVYSSFTWSGPASFTSMLEDPQVLSVTIGNAGTYRVTVADNAGCTATAVTSVAVSTSNVPSIIANSNSPICGGANLILTSTPTGGSPPYNTFAWTGPNGYSSNKEDPTPTNVYPNGVSTYLVTVTDNKNCTASASVDVLVLGPTATPTSNSPVCPNQNIELDGGPFISAGVTYAWSGPNNYSSALRIPTPFPATAATVGVYTLTITENNCSGVGTTTVSLGDAVPPNITCPANTTIEADANCTSPLGSYAATSISDNCNPNPMLSQSPAASTVMSGHDDVETVTLTADDGNGNTASCSFTVTLKDVTKPSIACPANITVNADVNCNGSVAAYSPVSISDNCTANPEVTQSPAATTLFNGHNTVQTVTLTADDGHGNTQSCSLTLTLRDVIKPSIICPANTTVAADANCRGVIGGYSPVSVSDNCTLNPTVTQSPAPTTALIGANDMKTVTLTADDLNGNTFFCTFQVTLKDVTKPSITCPANTTVAADASCSATVGVRSALSVSDNCAANPSVTQSPSSLTVLSGHNDVETVTLTANDGSGNTQSCSFTVTLKDVTKPSITCPANTTVATDANCSGIVGVRSPASVSDNCTTNPTVTQSPVSTTVLNGHNDVETVTLTANDGNGNTQFCSFTVTLKDVTKPSITCPANTTVAADANCSGAVGSYSPLSVSDNCTANPTVSQRPSVGTLLTGHNDFEIVTLVARDALNNTQFCTFTVTLKDVTPPTVVCKPYTVALNSSGSSSISTGNVFQSGSDNCGVVNQVSVVPSTFTCANLGTNNVVLNVNDGKGNNASCTAVVTVVDQTPPNMSCRSITATLNAAGTASVTPAQINNSSNDNCTLSNLSLSQTVFTCANLGSNTVVLTGTDQSGNINTCQSTVTVVDNIKPVTLCRNTTLNLNSQGQATLSVAAVDNGSSDNCQPINFSLSQTLFTCDDLGDNTITLQGADQAGNISSCTTRVTVRDLIAPTALCKDITVYLNNNGIANIIPFQVDNGSTDNCGSISRTVSRTQFTCSDIGAAVNNFLTILDGSGNSAECTAVVTVIDNIAPVAICHDTTVTLGPTDMVSVFSSMLADSSADNCAVWSFTPAVKVYSAANIGQNNLIITVKDWSDNAASCTAVVTVLDNNPPERPEGAVIDGILNGINHQKPGFKMAVFPNPTSGDAFLEFELPSDQAYTLQVTDVTGKTYLQEKGAGIKGSNRITLKMNQAPTGIYFVELRSQELKALNRLMVQQF